MRMRSRVVFALLLVAVGGVLAVGAFHVPLLKGMADWLDVGKRPEPADYVMVLGGEENTRPFVAAALIKAGLAREVLCARVATDPADDLGAMPSSHQVIGRILIARGVAPERIHYIGDQVGTTYDEAVALAAFLEATPTARTIVVTSNYHTRRARWVFTLVHGKRSAHLSFVSSPAYGFSAVDWWQTEDGFELVLAEYLKLLFYGVQYGYWGYGIAAAILAVLVLYFSRNGVAQPMKKWFGTFGGRQPWRSASAVGKRPPIVQIVMRVLCVSYMLVLTMLLLVRDPGGLLGFPPEVPLVLQWLIQSAHFTTFAVLSFLVFSSRWPLWSWLLVLILCIYAAGTELGQGLVATRTPELGDLMLDLLGILVGGLFYWFLTMVWCWTRECHGRVTLPDHVIKP